MEINGTKEETQTIQAPAPSFNMNIGQAPTCSDMFSYKPPTGKVFNQQTGGRPAE